MVLRCVDVLQNYLLSYPKLNDLKSTIDGQPLILFNNMKTFIFRPSVEEEYRREILANLFETMTLVDKTIVNDRIVYIFNDKD